MAQNVLVNEKGEISLTAPQIYGLIGKAMQKIGAIGKNTKNQQQGFMYRGIDAVMNALSPVMSELGLFICPEVLEQTREERVNKNGTTLLYSILKIKYTMYAPDGSNVSCVVIGEGMDSGDKASNKAMSVGMKYAAFQLFMIPTEEMVDTDAECHEVKPKQPAKEVTANVVNSVPETVPVLTYLANECEQLRAARKLTKAENKAIWNKQIEVLRSNNLIPDKALSNFTQVEAESMVSLMYKRFETTGTELLPA